MVWGRRAAAGGTGGWTAPVAAGDQRCGRLEGDVRSGQPGDVGASGSGRRPLAHGPLGDWSIGETDGSRAVIPLLTEPVHRHLSRAKAGAFARANDDDPNPQAKGPGTLWSGTGLRLCAKVLDEGHGGMSLDRERSQLPDDARTVRQSRFVVKSLPKCVRGPWSERSAGAAAWASNGPPGAADGASPQVIEVLAAVTDAGRQPTPVLRSDACNPGEHRPVELLSRS